MTSFEWGSKEWANAQLRFGIRLCRGYIVECRPSIRVGLILGIKDLLNEQGFWWQAKTLDHWLHRYHREIYRSAGSDLSQERERRPS